MSPMPNPTPPHHKERPHIDQDIDTQIVEDDTRYSRLKMTA